MNAEIIAALNALLEEERATVDALVALVSMATDTVERQALTAMGGQAVQGCIDLHEHLAQLDGLIGQRVSSSTNRILSPEHLDDRLRAFSALQLALAHRCEQLQAMAGLEPETYAVLGRLRDVQLAHALWSDRRAEEFAATRPEPDPALAPFSSSTPGAHSDPRWALPLPDRRIHLTPRFAATYAATANAADSGVPAAPTARATNNDVRADNDALASNPLAGPARAGDHLAAVPTAGPLPGVAPQAADDVRAGDSAGTPADTSPQAPARAADTADAAVSAGASAADADDPVAHGLASAVAPAAASPSDRPPPPAPATAPELDPVAIMPPGGELSPTAASDAALATDEQVIPVSAASASVPAEEAEPAPAPATMPTASKPKAAPKPRAVRPRATPAKTKPPAK